MITVEGVRTTCGSKILENYVAPYQATAIDKLANAGAVFLGKTNTDEFAMGSQHRELGLFPYTQSVGPQPRARRIERWQRGRGRRG